MTNSFLGLWVYGADAWADAVHALPYAEVLRAQARLARATGEWAIRFRAAAWMRPAPGKQRPVAERTAAQSLRVVEGGRR